MSNDDIIVRGYVFWGKSLGSDCEGPYRQLYTSILFSGCWKQKVPSVLVFHVFLPVRLKPFSVGIDSDVRIDVHKSDV